MKHIYSFLLIIASLITVFFLASGIDSSSGSPGGKTGSIGDGGVSCTQCHTGSAVMTDGLIATTIPGEGYLAGETYEITVTSTDAAAALFGFELTAEDASGNKVGTFSLLDATETKLVNSNSAVSHTAAGTTPSGDMRSWSVEWQAPADVPEQITFYTAVNKANGNGGTNGDVILTSNLTVEINDVSVEEISKISGVYPNPASTYLNVDLYDDPTQSIQIYSLNGQLIDRMPVSGQSTTIDVQDFNPGIYFIQADQGKLHKFVKR